MNIIGLTGGIGSGKTTVAKEFVKLGIPVYIADEEAKMLMNSSEGLKKEIIDLLGEESYINGVLNRPYIGQQIFNNKDLLAKMNALVHPAVGKHFSDWVAKQQAPYVIKEAAILFETGGYKACDFMITVVTPVELRINRVMQRDQLSREDVLAKINNQWSDDDKLFLSDFAVENVDIEKIPLQVCNIHKELMLLLVKK